MCITSVRQSLLVGLTLVLLLFGACRRSAETPAPEKGDGAGPPTAKGAPTVTADPNPVPLGSSPGPGKTTVTWTTGDTTFGDVYLSVDGGAEKPFALRRREGKQEAAWINKGKTYEFRLYSTDDRKKLLASVKVTRSEK